MPSIRSFAPLSLVLLVCFGLSVARPAQAGNYTFTTIIENTSANYPSINNAGTVAVSSAGKIYTGNGGPVTQVSPGNLSALPGIQSTSINSAGDVSFIAIQGALDRYSVYRASSGIATKIVAPINGYSTGWSAALADNGTVATLYGGLGAPFDPVGVILVTGNGGGLTTVNSNASVDMTHDFGSGGPLFPVSASNSGDLAYFWFTGQPNSFDVRAIHNGTEKTVAAFHSNVGDPAGVSSVAINDFGMVAIAGGFNSANSGLFLGNGDTLTQVATASLNGPYRFVLYASINNSGDYAFLGSTNDVSGIFTGPNPLTDKVIASGDSLAGSTVRSLQFGNDALNDHRQLTFWALLEDGRSGVFVANPVPEPSSVILLGLGLLTLGVLHWRRKTQA